MTVSKRENAIFEPKSHPVSIRNLSGERYVLDVERSAEKEKDALWAEVEYAHRAKEQAIEINYRLENRLREANKEIERLNEEINELNKLYRKALDENRELEQMNEIMMKLVYIFTKRELGL